MRNVSIYTNQSDRYYCAAQCKERHTMTQQQKFRNCPGCKVILPYQEGPYNRYGINSPECWAAFTELLAQESEHYGYPPAHRLIVDAYAVQHPPHLEHQLALKIEKRLIDASIQSIVIHLIALYAAFEEQKELLAISRIMDRVLTNVNQEKAVFQR